MSKQYPEISIILPCRDEEAAIGWCLEQLRLVITCYNLSAEIVVSDSSSDRSPEIVAQYAEVKLVKHNQIGYGRAYLAGAAAATGQYLFFADADATYDFQEIPRFIAGLRDGEDFVIGNRFAGAIESGAMPWLHRYLGNPLLSALTRFIFKLSVRDVHCGMRALKRSAFEAMQLKTSGMELATEMVVKAKVLGLRVAQLPINYHSRLGTSKLKTFSDGWRHLRFMASAMNMNEK